MQKTKIFRNLAWMGIIFFVLSSSAYGLGIEAAIGIWNQDPRGYISYKGESLSLDNTLRYDQETRLMARAKIDMPLLIPNIYLMYTPTEFKGTGIRTSNFTFGNVTFSGNVKFHSKLKLDHYDIALYYGIPFINTATLGKLNIDLGLNCRILELEASIDQYSLGLHESKSLTVPIPMGYMGIQIKPLKYLHVEGEIRGIAYQGNAYYDLIGRIKVKIFGPLFFTGGYRYEKLKVDYSDVKSDIEMRGPFAEIGFNF